MGCVAVGCPSLLSKFVCRQTDTGLNCCPILFPFYCELEEPQGHLVWAFLSNLIYNKWCYSILLGQNSKSVHGKIDL